MEIKLNRLGRVFLTFGFSFGVLLGCFSIPKQVFLQLGYPDRQPFSTTVLFDGKKTDERDAVDSQDNILILNQSASIPYHRIVPKSNSIEKDVYSELEGVFLGLKLDEQVQFPFDAEFIAKCEECIQLLRDRLLSGNLLGEQFEQLVDWLSQSDHPELADMLLSAVATMIAQDGYTERSGIIVSSLENFTSTEVANGFADYYVNNQNAVPELQESLLRVINNATDRDQVGSYIAEKFATVIDPYMRDKLLEINHPESLEKISALALGQGDAGLYSSVVEQIKSNPSQHAFDVLLSMYQTQSAGYFDGAVSVEEVATQWAYHQLSGSRLDFIEEQLAQGYFSEQDKQLTLAILKHSEDQVRGREIIAKFWVDG